MTPTNIPALSVPGEGFFPLDPAKQTPAQDAWLAPLSGRKSPLPLPKIPVITFLNDKK